MGEHFRLLEYSAELKVSILQQRNSKGKFQQEIAELEFINRFDRISQELNKSDNFLSLSIGVKLLNITK